MQTDTCIILGHEKASMRQIAGLQTGNMAYCEPILTLLQFHQIYMYRKRRASWQKQEEPFPKAVKTRRKAANCQYYLVLGGAVILIFAVFFTFQKKPAAYTPEITGRPNLALDKEKVDLGDVKLGTPVKVSFAIQNTGDQPLKFSQAPYIEVKEGC